MPLLLLLVTVTYRLRYPLRYYRHCNTCCLHGIALRDVRGKHASVEPPTPARWCEPHDTFRSSATASHHPPPQCGDHRVRGYASRRLEIEALQGLCGIRPTILPPCDSVLVLRRGRFPPHRPLLTW